MNSGFRSMLGTLLLQVLCTILSSLSYVTFMMDKATTRTTTTTTRLLTFGIIGISISIFVFVPISALGNVVAYPGYLMKNLPPNYAPYYGGMNPWPGLGLGASAGGGWPLIHNNIIYPGQGMPTPPVMPPVIRVPVIPGPVMPMPNGLPGLPGSNGGIAGNGGNGQNQNVVGGTNGLPLPSLPPLPSPLPSPGPPTSASYSTPTSSSAAASSNGVAVAGPTASGGSAAAAGLGAVILPPPRG